MSDRCIVYLAGCGIAWGYSFTYINNCRRENPKHSPYLIASIFACLAISIGSWVSFGAILAEDIFSIEPKLDELKKERE